MTTPDNGVIFGSDVLSRSWKERAADLERSSAEYHLYRE